MDYIIIDDEAAARAIIQELCTSHDDLNQVGVFSNPIEAIKFLNDQSVDLIFLDIHMPNFSGFDVIKTLKIQPQIILTTSDPEFAFEAFDYKSIIDYLVKPIAVKRFDRAIKKAQIIFKNKKYNSNNESTKLNDYFYININKKLIKIDLKDLCFIEAKGDYVHVKTDHANYIVHNTLKSMLAKLPHDNFFKVHRSYIVNLKKIDQIEESSVLINNFFIPIGKIKKKELFNRLNLL